MNVLPLTVLTLVALPMLPGVGSTAWGAASAGRCAALAREDFSQVSDAPTQIIKTEFVGSSSNGPTYCRVEGYVAPTVGFELRLPEVWNGKFLQVGSGGHAGTFDPWVESCPIDKGYACLVTDMGHKGAARDGFWGYDGLWGYENLQARLDWGFRATHVVTIAGKAVTASYYGESPRKSYFMGCSTGGRQALQEAQRFPWDYDGIIASAPPTNLSAIYINAVWASRVSVDATGKRLLESEDLKLLTDSAMARCDLDDGIKDGIISDPMHCAFDPAQLACKSGETQRCLGPAQVEAARLLYAGAMDSHGRKLSRGGSFPGTERSWSPSPRDVVSAAMANGLRYLFFSPERDPSWKAGDFDFDRDYKRLGIMETLVDATNPDLREYKAAGGKLIAYQGLSDSVIARGTIDYYETVERAMGGPPATQDFFRLFVAPGVGHCSGGVGADAVDLLGALEAWVEHGQAPDRLLSGHLKEDSPPFAYPYRQFPADSAKLSFTRPMFPYPTRAKYTGLGDPKDAANFVPVNTE